MRETKSIPETLRICEACKDDVIEGAGDCESCRVLNSPFSRIDNAPLPPLPVESIKLGGILLRLTIVGTIVCSAFAGLGLFFKAVFWLEKFIGGLLHG